MLVGQGLGHFALSILSLYVPFSWGPWIGISWAKLLLPMIHLGIEKDQMGSYFQERPIHGDIVLVFEELLHSPLGWNVRIISLV